ncbi:hypothetical protein ACFYXQ_15245 [Nocardia jiangxiensis]|uniref:Uncharacterized protein n=1 Tax=Nocardia jiangxiensis TaxID=282685 RepID=A0ABW6RYM2_9NOCA
MKSIGEIVEPRSAPCQGACPTIALIAWSFFDDSWPIGIVKPDASDLIVTRVEPGDRSLAEQVNTLVPQARI